MTRRHHQRLLPQSVRAHSAWQAQNTTEVPRQDQKEFQDTLTQRPTHQANGLLIVHVQLPRTRL